MAAQYYCAPDAKVYINGIYVEEIYDIQYQYRELKEPIYGYLSKHFDKVVRGTVIVTGGFTVNYTHDQYLPAILWKGTDPAPSQLINPSQTYESKINKYKAALSSYKEAKDMEAKIAKLEQDALSLKNNKDNVNQAQNLKNEQLNNGANQTVAQAQYGVDFFNSTLTQEEIAKCDTAYNGKLVYQESSRAKISVATLQWETDVAAKKQQIDWTTVLRDKASDTLKTTDRGPNYDAIVNDIINYNAVLTGLEADIAQLGTDLNTLCTNIQTKYNDLIDKLTKPGWSGLITDQQIVDYFSYQDALTAASGAKVQTSQDIISRKTNIPELNTLIGSTVPAFKAEVNNDQDLNAFILKVDPEASSLLKPVPTLAEAFPALTLDYLSPPPFSIDPIIQDTSIACYPSTPNAIAKDNTEKLADRLTSKDFKDKIVALIEKLRLAAVEAKNDLGLDPLQEAYTDNEYYPDRAENHEDYLDYKGNPIKFDIVIEYKGVPHVKIKDISLVSHVLSLGMGGAALKASFQFLASTINNDFGQEKTSMTFQPYKTNF